MLIQGLRLRELSHNLDVCHGLGSCRNFCISDWVEVIVSFFWCVLFWIESHVTVVRTPCFHVLLTTSLPERYIEKSEKIQIWPKIHYSAWHSWHLCTGRSFLMKVHKLITWHTSLRDYWILSMGMYACSLNLDGIF